MLTKLIEDGEQELNKEYYLSDSAVNVWDEEPEKEGYVFIGWKDQNGKIYKSADVLTQNISTPYVLTAQWEKGVDVYVNITIDHTVADGSGGIANDRAKHNVSYDLMTKLYGKANYTDVLTKDITWDGESEFTAEDYNPRDWARLAKAASSSPSAIMHRSAPSPQTSAKRFSFKS